MTIFHLKEDIKRLARMASGLADAHTAAVFLPTDLVTGSRSSLAGSRVAPPNSLGSPIVSTRSAIPLTNVVGSSGLGARTPSPANLTDKHSVRRESIELVGAHSLSPCLVRDCRIPLGSGLLGWVAETGRPIHVAPFEIDSGSLGIYSEHEAIKALIAVPIPLPTEGGESPTLCGVLMCDSRKAPSFSKAQIKQLEEVALQVSRIVFWAMARREGGAAESSWQAFSYRVGQLAEAIGLDSVELLRISIQNLSQLEATLGLSGAIDAAEQFVRLIHQALPPHFPVTRLPSGEILIAVDNMMSSFFQQKVRALALRPDKADRSLALSITSYCSKGLRLRVFDVDAVLMRGCISAPAGSTISTTKTAASAGGGTRA